MYEASALSKGQVYTLPLDVSPSVLVPYFDEDSGVLFLCGRGDTGILPVEVTLQDSTPLHALSRYDSSSIQQGVSILSRSKLDVASVEVARCWRLTQTSVEPISFTVPRNRKEFFQDDLFPPTRDWEQASMSTSEFLNDTETVRPPPKTQNLCPSGMVKLSEAPAEVKPESKYTRPTGEPILTDSQRQEKVFSWVDERKHSSSWWLGVVPERNLPTSERRRSGA